ncbi:hepatic and glial cell adhesion molecule-like [Labrus bergylta]|uniref:hepatic and glial cell adhesion molecule-like n=1 Tax=Labrus bergylta TaxID=56723 RepID=UPI003313A1AC
MACFAAALLLLLSGFINLMAANKDSCDLYAAVGQNMSLPFIYEGLTSSHVLRWTHNNSIIFYRQQGRVSVGKSGDITPTGSLILKNLQPLSAGSYQANVLYPNATSAKTWSSRLCMMDEVSKPKLTYSCDFKSSAVNLNCEVVKAQGLVFSWTLDEKTLTSETRQTLSISLAQLKGERRFTCSVENKVSIEKSVIVRPTCKAPPPSPPTLVCFKSSIVVTVFAAGVGLILLLLIIVVILCCRNKHNKTQMKAGGRGELRMLSLNKQEMDSDAPDYETMHPSEDSPPATPEPSARDCYKNVSQPEAETENSPPQLSSAAEGQRPSPVPKPRTRSPPTQNI